MTIKPFLSKVTVTGADDTVPPEALFQLQKQYPYAEFGILLSEKYSYGAGTLRFPSKKWLHELVVGCELAGLGRINLSGHLCGSYVRWIYGGVWVSLDAVEEGLQKRFQRFQINTHAEQQEWVPNKMSTLLRALDVDTNAKPPRQYAQTVIFQLDDRHGTYAAMESVRRGHRNIAGLHDLSHGAGVVPETWSKPLQGLVTGYAGGLSPRNVREHLFKIQEVAGDGAWIDAETHLRSGGMFDLDKCAAFLGAAKPWVKVE